MSLKNDGRPSNPRNATEYDKLMDKMKLDETFTKSGAKIKYDRVKNNLPPLSDYNFMADLIMLPETKKKFKYLFTIVDLWSDEFDCEPLKTKKPAEVLKAMKKIFKGKYLKKPYATLATDGGTEFKGVFHKYLYDENIYHKISQPYRHKQTANIENLNKLLNRFLTAYMNKMTIEKGFQYNEWTEILNKLKTELNAIRERPDENPFTYKYSSPIYKTPKFNVGDVVFYKLERPKNALNNDAGGRFRVGDLRYNIEEPRKIIKILYYPNNVRYMLEGMPNVSYTEDELIKSTLTYSKFAVRKIIGKKTVKRVLHYLVWFKNQLKKDATWEPKKNLIEDGIGEYIKEFEKSIRDKTKAKNKSKNKK